jgi:hypothetical protein
VLLTICGVLILSLGAHAQRGRGAGGPPPAAQAAAGADLTGYWVTVVTEDWRWRMVVPAKGDFASLPLTAEGRRVGNEWDPAKETAADRCKAYGAGGIMRVPTRLRITWENPNTLKVETDAGTQTRVFSFPGGGVPVTTAIATGRTLQGNSVATWEYGGGAGARAGGPVPPGQLKVVTTGMQAGYLRRNGAPYSESAVITEFFNRLDQPDGSAFMVVTTTVEDPLYLNARFTVSSNFKKEADGSKWKPTPCE